MAKRNLIIPLMITLLTGCSLIAHYDFTSYQNLTDLKGEMKTFFDACAQTPQSGERALGKIEHLKISAAQAYEYEKGKKLNDDTTAQLEIIDRTTGEVVERFAKNVIGSDQNCRPREAGPTPDAANGCLSPGYCKAKWSVLETALDTAIATENSKLK